MDSVYSVKRPRDEAPAYGWDADGVESALIIPARTRTIILLTPHSATPMAPLVGENDIAICSLNRRLYITLNIAPVKKREVGNLLRFENFDHHLPPFCAAASVNKFRCYRRR